MIIKSPVSWVGNKTSILHILYALFPVSYERYIEPFGGSGAVLLGKAGPDKFEVYNDYNGNLVNLFRCMRDRPLSFIRELYKKAMHDYDLRRAVMFLKLIRYSYSSSGKSFSCQPFSVRSLFGLIQDFSIRMENAVIENQDFEVLISHYDRPDAFIYCDPPYFNSEYVYECGFTWEDHVRLQSTLADAKGKWLVSYNDCPEIRDLYRGAEFFDFARIHSMVQKYEAGKEFPELLIGNYDLYERERRKPHQMTLFSDPSFGYEKTLKECIISCKKRS